MKHTASTRRTVVFLLATAALSLTFFCVRACEASDFALAINTGGVALGVGNGPGGTSFWLNSGYYYPRAYVAPYYVRPLPPPPPPYMEPYRRPVPPPHVRGPVPAPRPGGPMPGGPRPGGPGGPRPGGPRPGGPRF